MLLINLKTPKGWRLVFFRLERKSKKGTLMKFTLLQFLFNKDTKKYPVTKIKTLQLRRAKIIINKPINYEEVCFNVFSVVLIR